MKLIAFAHGLIEHRSDITTHYPEPYIEWYDKGRSIATRLRGKQMSRIMIDSYPNKWHYYLSQLAGTPCAQCAICGQIYVYWETEDLECHTEQHETENN